MTSYPESDSCFLDGRYFNLVFENYPGLIHHPLIITFHEHVRNNQMSFSQSVEFCSDLDLNKSQPGLLRVVILTDCTRHSNLVILDYANGQAYRFEPLGTNAPYFLEVNRAIKDILHRFELTLNVIEVDAPLNEMHPECIESGYCNAYNILYGLSFLEDRDFDPNNIRRFVAQIEDEHGMLSGEPEVEYGPYDGQTGQPQNILAGGLIGGLAGGLLAGPAGALVGGIGGAAIGSTVHN